VSRGALTDEQRRLVEQHLHLARAAASRHCGKGGLRFELYDDVFADACLGLTQAALHWRPGGGASFATFARRRIDGAIIDSVRLMQPLSRGEYARGVQRPTFVPIDEPVVDEMTWADVLPDIEPGPEERALGHDVLALLDVLPLRYRMIMLLRAIGETQPEIAKRLGITASRVSQLETVARRKICKAVLAA
jgi:RNA polymerase sigma factor (sigma-70 family)